MVPNYLKMYTKIKFEKGGGNGSHSYVWKVEIQKKAKSSQIV